MRWAGWLESSPKHTRHVFAGREEESSDVLVLYPIDRGGYEKVFDWALSQSRCIGMFVDGEDRGGLRLSTCWSATTESAGRLCCASWSRRKVSGATVRCCWGGGMDGCWLLGYMVGGGMRSGRRRGCRAGRSGVGVEDELAQSQTA